MYPQIFPDAVTVVYATLLDLQRSGLAPGVLRSSVDGGKVFKLCKNTHSAALVIGDPVCYDLTTNVSEFEVKQPATAILNHLAGVAVGALPISGFGWIQIFGKCAAVRVIGSGTAILLGDTLKGVNASSLLLKDQTTGTESTFSNRIIAGAASVSADTTIAGFISCLGL